MVMIKTGFTRVSEKCLRHTDLGYNGSVVNCESYPIIECFYF